MRRLPPQARGFTLAETMIALAILGMIGALVFGTFSRAMDGRERASAITTRYHQIRQAMLRMSREISMAYLSAHRDCEDPRTRTQFVAKRASNGMRLDFTSFSHFKMLADGNESDQNELSYFVGQDPDDNDQKVLMRRSQGRIDDEPDEGGTEQVLCEGVTSLEFEFYDPKEDRWEDDWDSTGRDYRNRLPMFVSITLTAADPSGKEQKFTSKTRVFLKEAINIPGSGFSPCLD